MFSLYFSSSRVATLPSRLKRPTSTQAHVLSGLFYGFASLPLECTSALRLQRATAMTTAATATAAWGALQPEAEEAKFLVSAREFEERGFFALFSFFPQHWRVGSVAWQNIEASPAPASVGCRCLFFLVPLSAHQRAAVK